MGKAAQRSDSSGQSPQGGRGPADSAEKGPATQALRRSPQMGRGRSEAAGKPSGRWPGPGPGSCQPSGSWHSCCPRCRPAWQRDASHVHSRTGCSSCQQASEQRANGQCRRSRGSQRSAAGDWWQSSPRTKQHGSYIHTAAASTARSERCRGRTTTATATARPTADATADAGTPAAASTVTSATSTATATATTTAASAASAADAAPATALTAAPDAAAAAAPANATAPDADATADATATAAATTGATSRPAPRTTPATGADQGGTAAARTGQHRPRFGCCTGPGRSADCISCSSRCTSTNPTDCNTRRWPRPTHTSPQPFSGNVPR